MRNLIGMEMVCFGKSKHFTLDYVGGEYLDPKGEPVEDVLDMTCYVCASSFYTREGDAIPYCPNCGHIDRKRFDQLQDIQEFMRGMDLSWLKRNGLTAVVVQSWDDGAWTLKFVDRPEAIEATGKYRAVRKL